MQFQIVGRSRDRIDFNNGLSIHSFIHSLIHCLSSSSPNQNTTITLPEGFAGFTHIIEVCKKHSAHFLIRRSLDLIKESASATTHASLPPTPSRQFDAFSPTQPITTSAASVYRVFWPYASILILYGPLYDHSSVYDDSVVQGSRHPINPQPRANLHQAHQQPAFQTPLPS